VLHHQINDAVVLADVVERADVRVCQRGYGAGLPLEAARGPDRHSAQREDLDATVRRGGCRGLIDLTHAPSADGGLNLVRARRAPEERAWATAGIVAP